MATKRFVDANVLLRYVLQGEPSLNKETNKIIEESGEDSLILTAVIVAEVVYILLKQNLSRRQVADTILGVSALPSIELEDRTAIEAAIELFGSHGLDFADCYILERSVSKSIGLATQDKKLNNARHERM